MTQSLTGLIRDTNDVIADLIHNHCDNGTRNTQSRHVVGHREPFEHKRTPTRQLPNATTTSPLFEKDQSPWISFRSFLI